MKPSEMASTSNSRWQTCKERPNEPTNNGDMAERAKRPVNDGVRKCRSQSVTTCN